MMLTKGTSNIKKEFSFYNRSVTIHGSGTEISLILSFHICKNEQLSTAHKSMMIEVNHRCARKRNGQKEG
ncbi:hypothetical protein [Staphylococcus lutrae]|uniref:Uncharacterized protein n=1 Tax=Staphylococcus lutrae TaxID=155085 RepID=A0AAC9RNJ8_9STAP|nr:hypothetical protein [Staphylococcus lutrae]ARJ50451.1 hypothetical protein B5P37_03570 [Staphylococcus lutrae]PNZ38180.1 hypothetical protein CD134_04835 [Staphylococcus lutrae]